MTEKQSLFEFHTGFKRKHDDEQSVMDCPFCEKEESFWFNKDGLWDCKAGRCKKSGNAFVFIREMYALFDNVTSTAELIRDLRGIPTEYTRENGLKFNTLTNSVMIPCFKHDKVHALYKAVKNNEDKFTIYASPKEGGIEHALMHWPETTNDIIWVVEGHWDKLAADAIIGHRNPITAIAVPGSGVWKPGWCEILEGKHVCFMYDNDTSGRTGYERVIIKEIAKSRFKPKSIQYLHWPPGTKEGYDLNDLYRDHKRQSFNFIDDHSKTFATPENSVVVKETIETVPADPSCDTWDKLVAKFKEAYYVTPDMEMCLAALLASIYSLKIDGEQLWYKIIGPPGCGKTSLAKIISACEQVILRSTFTGLFSGWKDESEDDASLAALIVNKALVVKDADALIKQPNVSQIFSEFRDFYDKDSSTQYKNRIHHNYRNARSSMLLFGTNILRRTDHSFLGERYLDYELRVSERDKIEIKKKVRQKATQMALFPDTPSLDLSVQSACKGFVEHHLMNKSITSALPADEEDFIDRISTLVASMRTDVDRDMGGRGEVTFSPVVEVPSRLIGQLMKLALIIPIVTGDKRYSDRLITKIAVDIIDPTSNRFQIVRQLRDGWFSREQLVEATGIPKTTVTRVLDDIRILKMVDIKYSASGVGRKRMDLTLNDNLKENITLLGF
jgi:ribosomal protein L37AE/L43A